MPAGEITLPFFTGWEVGSPYIVPDAQWAQGISLPVVVTNPVHTGTYALALGTTASVGSGGMMEWSLASTRSDIYIALWTHGAENRYNGLQVGIVLSDSYCLHLRYDGGYHVDAYVGGTEPSGFNFFGGSKVADGSLVMPGNDWKHIEVYFSIANSGGRIQTWIDGLPDIDYTGDTLPSSSDQIQFVRLIGSEYVPKIDDFHVHSSRIGDRRVQAKRPTSDDTAQFTASGGGSNYSDVDDSTPDDDSTYTYTSTDAQKDLFGHGAFTLTDYEDYWINVWMRARKTVAAADQLRILIESNGTEDQGDWEDILTSYDGYFHEVWTTDPDTATAWLAAAVDAVLFGYESEIAP